MSAALKPMAIIVVILLNMGMLACGMQSPPSESGLGHCQQEFSNILPEVGAEITGVTVKEIKEFEAYKFRNEVPGRPESDLLASSVEDAKFTLVTVFGIAQGLFAQSSAVQMQPVPLSIETSRKPLNDLVPQTENAQLLAEKDNCFKQHSEIYTRFYKILTKVDTTNNGQQLLISYLCCALTPPSN